jgi:hypothetical protein
MEVSCLVSLHLITSRLCLALLFRCNICGMLNDVPSTYFSHLDSKGQRRDKDQRPELSRCSVEFMAPGDYMVRPPQPPVYFFVIDVSEPAISSGMIQSCVQAIKQSLDELPGSPRTQVGKCLIHFLSYVDAKSNSNLSPKVSSLLINIFISII